MEEKLQFLLDFILEESVNLLEEPPYEKPHFWELYSKLEANNVYSFYGVFKKDLEALEEKGLVKCSNEGFGVRPVDITWEGIHRSAYKLKA